VNVERCLHLSPFSFKVLVHVNALFPPISKGSWWPQWMSQRQLQRFCGRLGFEDDIETAEEKRARRKGVKRATDLHQGNTTEIY